MRRLHLLAVVASAAAVLGLALRDAQQAHAVAPAQVVGVYKIKLRGDGWLRGKTEPYRVERIGGTAHLILTRTVPDDGKLNVAIQLDSALSGGLVDVATPTPDFAGSGHLVGDSVTVIGNGAPTYVNALTVTFLKDGARVVGHWLAAFPPSDADPAASSASAIGIDFVGRRQAKRDAAIGAR